MTINESIKEWVQNRIAASYPDLADVEIVTVTSTGDLEPEFLTIYETGSSQYEQGSVAMDGVSNVEIAVEYHSIPATADDGGTSPADTRSKRQQFYDILGDRAAIDYVSERNGWRVFDIRLGSPTTEPDEGRNVTRWELSLVACPI